MDENWENKIQYWMNKNHIEISDLDLVKEALTHSSYKGMGYDVKDNERLEFLGDAVLDLILAENLMKNPKLNEGQMTDIRKIYVNNEYLSIIFEILKMSDLIRTAKDFNVSGRLKAGFVEAIFGAIFLEQGYERSYEVWVYFKEQTVVDELFTRHKYHNPKGKLLELFQKPDLLLPVYKTEQILGPDHSPTFQCVIQVSSNEREITVEEIGISKKDAEKNASVEMLKKLRELLYFNSR